MKVGGEVSGSRTVEGSAKRTAKEIAEKLKAAAHEGGRAAKERAGVKRDMLHPLRLGTSREERLHHGA